ncbi:monocarboxylate transporter 9-like [Lytechinus pictus]|uniref:monocarboxylate transporter 9-like n=1 Tax=Lytechinus pictus TaxID=7653 RepID=UPI0030B9E002
MSSGTSSGRWRYVVLLTKFSLDFLTQGLLKAFGVLVPALVDKFETNYGTIGFILSVELTVFFMACPLVRILAKWINPRALCIMGSMGSSAAIAASAYVDQTVLFGVAMFMTGLFSAPINQISYEVLHQYFGERFGFVNSICLLGSLVGGMAFPVLTFKLLDAYGLEGALVCLAAVYLHCVPIAITFRSPHASRTGYHQASSCEDIPSDVGIAADLSDEQGSTFQPGDFETTEQNPLTVHQREQTVTSRIVDFFLVTLNFRVLVQEKAFCLLFLPCKFIVQALMVSWTLFVVSYAVTKGLDESLAAYLPLTGALGGFINQTVVTFILHFRPHWGAMIFTINMASAAVAFFFYQLNASFINFLVCSFFAGGCVFGSFPATYSVLLFYVATENFASILSIKLFVTGAAVVSSGYMSGSIYDVTGSFDDAFMILGAMSAAAAFLSVVLMLVKKVRGEAD